MLSTQLCYGKRLIIVEPADPAVSNDESSDEEDDDVADPDFIPLIHNLDTPCPCDMGPSAKRTCVRPAVEELEDEDNSDENEDEDQPAPQAKSHTKKGKPAARLTTWKKVDLDNQALLEYQHFPADFIDTPYNYFSRYFSPLVIKHITYQTNLYATQKDVNTTFTTTEDEMMTFIGILLYMGISELPSIDDYWAMETRVPQVANLMSSKRFRLMRKLVHFNDNTQIPGTIDRFFKVRPLFSLLVNAFRSEPQTPKQYVDAVMVAYNGKRADKRRQYVKNKPGQWGFKLFARASADGFIHDLVLYQGKTTLEAYDVPMTSEQQAMCVTSQIVSVLASTMSSSTTTAIFADNFFTSLEKVRYLKDKNCRNTWTARENRIGKPPLKSIKEMEKRGVPHCMQDYVTSDTLVYCTPIKSKRWYMQLFAYAIDVSLTNAWIMYRRDCKALAVDGLSLKNFQIQVFRSCSSQRPVMSNPQRSSSFQCTPSTSVDVPKPVRGHRSHTPHASERFDMSLFHAPVYTNRQTCKHCSKKGNILRSNVVCRVCKVHLCLNADRNCFVKYHEVTGLEL
ncbi:piggyBac transposable element-derived protein 2-like [Pseudorasbora parva]|uniref:piggyBac transposable element-derived protein 2-like n=1 Tax=Pseudorasbora parva TaxID=51549 RepID=UPI00351E5DA4